MCSFHFGSLLHVSCLKQSFMEQDVLGMAFSWETGVVEHVENVLYSDDGTVCTICWR